MEIKLNKADADKLIINENNCQTPFIEITDFYIEQFEIKPLKDYKLPVNSETGDIFPDCCPYHKQELQELNDWFIKFPNCCKDHKKMIGKWWFKKSNYECFPLKVVNQLSYTAHAIIHEIDKDDWFESITEYIEYNIMSFGKPAVCSGNYLHGLKNFLINQTKTNHKKIDRIVKYINDLYKPTNKSQEAFSIKALYEIYQKWLKVFPFDISYFKDMKVEFENQFPFLTGTAKTNRYSGLATAQPLTRYELINTLTIKTKQLLNSIDSKDLVEKGYITDGKKHLFDLASEIHRIKQADLLGDFNKIEKEYVSLLNSWLGIEQEYFEKISSYLKVKKNSEANIVAYPVINSKISDQFFGILKNFFSEADQNDLELLLKTGVNKTGKILFFKDYGNRLTDAFRQLKEKDLITGCQKKDLEKWICENFSYLSRKDIKRYTADYVEKCITRKGHPCKNPLFYLKNQELIRK